jgi:glycosyltransferase involved in cell wall biosynthesis
VIAIAPNDDLGVGTTLSKFGIHFKAVSFSRTGLNPFRDIWFCIQLIKIIRSYKPSIVIPYTVKPVIYGSAVSGIFSKAKVFPLITGIGYIETRYDSIFKKAIQKLMLLMYRVSIKSVEGVFFQNHDDKDYFLDKRIILEKTPTCVVNGSGINLNEFTNAPAVVKPIRFLLIARLIKAKGVELYLHAAKQIKGVHPEVEFHLIGQLDEQNPDSIDVTQLKAYVDQRIVYFHGFQNDVRDILAKSSVFVLPSYYREGVPRTILEAMAMSKPIITTNNVGCKETVEDGVNGFLIPVHAVLDLQLSMERFIKDPSIIKTMGIESYRIAKSKFDVNMVNRAMLSFMNIE